MQQPAPAARRDRAAPDPERTQLSKRDHGVLLGRQCADPPVDMLERYLDATRGDRDRSRTTHVIERYLDIASRDRDRCDITYVIQRYRNRINAFTARSSTKILHCRSMHSSAAPAANGGCSDTLSSQPRAQPRPNRAG